MRVAASIISLALLGLAAPAAEARPLVPLPNPLPRIVNQPCPIAAVGCWEVETLTVYTDGASTTTVHELGHAVDTLYLDDGERNRYRTITGVSRDAPWTAMQESFAELYEHCRDQDYLSWGSRNETPPGYRRLTERRGRSRCAFVARAMLDQA